MKSKYINPFTNYGFKKLFGQEINEYEDSFKIYRDNINVISTAKEEGREE